MSPLPAILVSTLEKLLASPPCIGSLSLLSPYSFFIFHFFISFQRGQHLFILEVEEGSRLIERRKCCSSREVVYCISDVPIKVFPLTLLYLTELTRVNPKRPNRVGDTIQRTSVVFSSRLTSNKLYFPFLQHGMKTTSSTHKYKTTYKQVLITSQVLLHFTLACFKIHTWFHATLTYE